MRVIGKFHLGVGAVVFVLCSSTPAWAWGPATHLHLAGELLSDLSIIPAALAALISRFTADFLYGNLAADVIFGKAFCKVKQHCHHWQNGFHLLHQAGNERGRAFAWGYLVHLAGDTVAHNKFVPRQLTVTRTTMRLGHLYWEMRADSFIDDQAWSQIRRLVRGDFGPHDDLMEAELQRTLFSFKTNRRIFRRQHLLSSAEAWQRGVRLWGSLSRWPLSRSLVEHYHGECRDRIVSLLQEGHDSSVLHEDPVGAERFSHAKCHRRHLRQMARAGVLEPYVLRETTAPLEPKGWRHIREGTGPLS